MQQSTYSVQVVEPAPSNAVRAHPHPILETGSLSFPEGRYQLDFEVQANLSSYKITHRIEHAPLIERLIAEEKAQYVCIVSCPTSWYRATHRSAIPTQLIEWNEDHLAESPMFTPMVVCLQPLELVIDSLAHGVHRIWNGERASFEAGSRLALGSVVYLQSSIEQLLLLVDDPLMKNGQMTVETNTEPFQFKVRLHTDVHRHLRHGGTLQNRNIMNHIVTACFSVLQNDFQDDDGDSGWQSHRSLRLLADFLEQQGIKHWSDHDFRPEEGATALYPIETRNLSAIEEEGG